ncbi:MBL fold metallo-hydrolase [Fontisphaera persica]|uniref:MBL fold metallo-hydrolase n=1 Tax=Fontisphaera persica TaxID=2974023 RepID=UPI0024C0261C|nr:MBL fold metallo-hydrolase [Fontisphaera persica]WCJ60542.1 MBL fold metallo-hydrolase [Fontisphaera persica]
MAKSRRTWLKYTLAATGLAAVTGAWWVHRSQSRAARVLRMLGADYFRKMAPPPHRPMPARWKEEHLTLSWLGHATTLINFFGVRLLLDPVFSPRVGPVAWMGNIGPKRYIAPALGVADIPAVDLIVLSHAHYDHFDCLTLRQLPKTATVITAPETSDLLEGMEFATIKELDWNEPFIFKNGHGELEIQAIQVRHWGQRWPNKKVRGYNGYIMRRKGRSVLFAGDTAMTPLFKQHRRLGPFDLAIMPIAAYDPWIWNHCTPEEAVEMANDAGARFIAPVHHETFKLSDEPMEEPVQRFCHALRAEPARIAWRQVGETFALDAHGTAVGPQRSSA